ncbi:MAG: type II toxin-antitoxin system Phd/YefM family antitoxin [Cyanobacteria bacterium J06648_16]
MSTLPVEDAQSNLQNVIDEVTESHTPVVIVGERSNAVILSEADWSSIQETLYLLAVPGMRESIKEGLATPIEDCKEELDW